MANKRSVTIREVARAAHVSAQTVSRVINNRPDVAESTRRRVQEIIAETGYSPNVLARSLIQGRTHTLGVVGYGLGYYGPSRTSTGIERQINELGYSLLLSLMREPDAGAGNELLGSLLSRKVDGIIWAVPEIGVHRQTLLQQIDQIGVPVVFINMQPHPDLAVVAIDNYNGGRQAALHLLSRGYRKVGIISGPGDWWESRQRLAGWRSAMLEAGHMPAERLESLQVEGDWYPSSGESGLESLLSRVPDLEAVFACNDPMALGALQAARRLGRRVPEDLAVVGYDDVPEARYYNPSLSTVRQPLAEMGAQAVRLLHRLLTLRESDADRPEQIWLQPELVVRSSSTR